jgi:hypothetical protein
MKTYLLDADHLKILQKRCFPFKCRGCGQAFKIGDLIVALIHVKG